MPAHRTANKRSDLRTARVRGFAPVGATAGGTLDKPTGAYCAQSKARTVESMPADLTAKQQSDLRVAAIRGAAASTVASDASSAVATMSGPASVHAQAEELKARLGGLVDRLPGATVHSDVPVIADVVALFGMPELPVDGATALLDGKGRFSCVEARTLLGWEPQDLFARTEGHWIVLRPTGSLTTSRCTPRLNGTDKVTLPAAQRRLLGVEPGRKVYVQPIPHADALALLNPAAVLLGAPLSLLATT